MLTSSAAIKEGLECWVVLEERVKGSFNKNASGNNYLYDLLGANKIKVPKGETTISMEKLKLDLENQGKKPYIVPGGGSYPIGTQAFIDSVKEIINYSNTNKIIFDYIFVCSGSGGTHTGLHIGCKLYNYNAKVIGISNSRSKEEQTEKIYKHIQKTIKYFNFNISIPKNEIIVIYSYI